MQEQYKHLPSYAFFALLHVWAWAWACKPILLFDTEELHLPIKEKLKLN